MRTKITTLMLLLGLPLAASAQSVSEITQEASASVQEINTIATQVAALLQQAQSGGDEAVLQCISTKQASISALQDISDIALGNIQGAAEPQKAAYEMRKITLSLSKVKQFGNEASRCSSGSSGSSGSAESGSGNNTEVTVDQSGVTTTIETNDSVEGESTYTFDSTSTSTSTSDVGGGTDAVNTAPETIVPQTESTPF